MDIFVFANMNPEVTQLFIYFFTHTYTYKYKLQMRAKYVRLQHALNLRPTPATTEKVERLPEKKMKWRMKNVMIRV